MTPLAEGNFCYWYADLMSAVTQDTVCGRHMFSELSQTDLVNTIQISDTFADIWGYKICIMHFCIFKYEKYF